MKKKKLKCYKLANIKQDTNSGGYSVNNSTKVALGIRILCTPWRNAGECGQGWRAGKGWWVSGAGGVSRETFAHGRTASRVNAWALSACNRTMISQKAAHIPN